MSDLDQMLLIKGNALFAPLSEKEIDDLQLIHHFREASPQEYIYLEHQYLECLFFLKDGFVKIGHTDADGQEVIREIIGPGDIFGNLSLDPKGRQSGFAQAYRSKVSLCMFRRHDFSQLLARRPELAITFNQQIGEKLVQLENRMVNLLHKTVRDRLLYFLLSLTRQFPQYLHHNQFLLPHHFPHEDIARLIGSTRPSVSSCLAQLELEGWVQSNRKQLCIPDVNELQKKLSVS